MKTPSTARAYLLGVAQTGRQFKHNEVLPDDATKADIVLGRGHDITRNIKIVDPQGVPRLVGEAGLRLIGLEKTEGGPDLFIRTRLTWAVGEVGTHAVRVYSNIHPSTEENYSGNYLSWAKYVIGEEGAGRLDEQLRAGTTDTWHDSQYYYDAEWNQNYPGALFSGFGVSQDQASYHQKAVLAAQEEHPALLGMLSTNHQGIVRPRELVDIAAWVSQNFNG
jgi:hypothetical protein